MSVVIGSARRDERGRYSGGKAGDNDGDEVSTQLFYVHSGGWYVIRPKSDRHATALAAAMAEACRNPNVGYDQGNRLAIIRDGIQSTKPTECDCSSLVRECVIEAMGKDPGNFTTDGERGALEGTGLFERAFSYTSTTRLCTGDVLVTKTKGHTAIVTKGTERGSFTKDDVVKLCKQVQSALGVSADGIFGPRSKAAWAARVGHVSKTRNAEGEWARFVQRGLNAKGAVLEVDGEFGPLSDAALRSFQKRVGIGVDGKAGKVTAHRLFN